MEKFNITPELALDIIIRRRWMILVPLSFALTLGIYLAFTLPKVYQAKTLILVESQRVPKNYVQSIVTEDTAKRISTISQQILSRTNLEKIIKDFGLFDGPKYDHLYIEDMVANLRKRIEVDVIRGGRVTNAFTVAFKGKDPETVMRVANGLAAYFIDENLKVRESQALGTSSFLEAELSTMRAKLERLEERIKNYRRNHMGELPEQLDTNLNILNRLQLDLANREQAMREAKIRLAELSRQAANQETPVIVINGSQGYGEGAVSIAQLQAQLEIMQSRYTNKHPDIKRLKKQIADLKAKKDAAPSSNGTPSGIPSELDLQIAEAKRDIKVVETEVNNVRDKIADYQRRVDNIPKREQELLSLRRDYDNVKSIYESLLNRKLEADIAVNMERKQKGEQFRIVDPARKPERPIEPDLLRIFAFLTAAGLGAGAGLAFLVEFVRPCFNNPEEIESLYGLPVLASIPRLFKPTEAFVFRLNQIAFVFVSILTTVLFGLLAHMSLKGPETAINAFKQIVGN